MKQVILIISGVVLAVGLVSGVFAVRQVNEEKLSLVADLQYRTRLLVESLRESVQPSYLHNSTSSLQSLVDRFADRERLAGLAVYDAGAGVVAASKGLSPSTLQHVEIVETVMDSDKAGGDFIWEKGKRWYAFAVPLYQEERVAGSLMVVQNASYIDAAIQNIWSRNILRFSVQALLIAFAIAMIIHWMIIRPLFTVIKSIQAVRAGVPVNSDLKQPMMFRPLLTEISKMAKSLIAARSAASEEARLRLEKIDSPWTAERLKEFVKTYLKDQKIFIVSNREPYSHNKSKNGFTWSVPASGMVTALDRIMEACGGMWIAHGSGDADRQASDKEGKVMVPPDEPKYTLKRVWLTPQEIQGYYLSFSNEALWPLCHMAHTRPKFRQEDWMEYRKVNGKFAKELLREIKDVENPIVLIQDYHLALLPKMIKASRPDARVGIFWHIPWPSPESFSICPWRADILNGMLGADLVGFHIQEYCNNFIETVGKEVESLIDLAQFTVTKQGHVTQVRPFPVSVDFAAGDTPVAPPSPQLLAGYGIHTKHFGLGVDRLDYTKGILERFRGIEFFLTSHPEYKKEFTFLQIAPPSREGIAKYQEYNKAVTKEAERINAKFREGRWHPIVLEKSHKSHEELNDLYRLADAAVITPVHDGMNLVAKEFVAARHDESGVLVLSQFTGSARSLRGALMVNPYSAEDTAEAIYKALTMSKTEQRRRMKSMREEVRNYNVYRWSADLIKAVAHLS